MSVFATIAVCDYQLSRHAMRIIDRELPSDRPRRRRRTGNPGRTRAFGSPHIVVRIGLRLGSDF